MKLKIAFDDTPLSEAVDLDILIVEHETRRQRELLLLALEAVRRGDTETAKKAVNQMDTP